MKLVFFALLAMGLGFSQIIIPAGTCQNFTLFNSSYNISDNSTFFYFEEHCAENSTLLTVINNTGDSGNFTLWANSTDSFNNGSLNVSCLGNLTVVQNLTVVNYTTSACPSVNLTMWANSTQNFIGNGTVTCLGNTAVQNITTVNASYNCSLALNITPTNAEQLFSDVNKNYSVKVSAIPSNYCYQNVDRDLEGYGIYRNDPTNTTVKCKITGNQLIGLQCPTHDECPAPVECPEQPACDAPKSCDDKVTAATDGLLASLGTCKDEKDKTEKAYLHELNLTETVDGKIDSKISSTLSPIGIFLGILFVAGGLSLAAYALFSIFKKRYGEAPLSASDYGEAMPKQAIADFKSKGMKKG